MRNLTGVLGDGDTAATIANVLVAGCGIAAAGAYSMTPTVRVRIEPARSIAVVPDVAPATIPPMVRHQSSPAATAARLAAGKVRARSLRRLPTPPLPVDAPITGDPVPSAVTAVDVAGGLPAVSGASMPLPMGSADPAAVPVGRAGPGLRLGAVRRPVVAYVPAVRDVVQAKAVSAVEIERVVGEARDLLPTLAETPRPAAVGPKQTAQGVEFEVGARVNGAAAGRIALVLEDSLIGHTDRVSDNISIRLGDLVTLLASRMSAAETAWLGSSSEIDRYVTLNELRAHGISVEFDDHDRLVFKAM